MSQVALRNITKRFGAVTALDDISFEIKNGELFVLLGPTGAGKTTTLRVIAGLTRPDAGRVLFDGESVDGLPPAERDVAFVFQQYSLYPTMTVYDNLAFPLRSPMRKLPEAEIKRRVTEAAEKLRIAHLLERKTARLSGGEMQRVAIGRAIVRQPRVYLMDEPLSNLDAKLREALRIELAHLQRTQGSTTLFVTHDQIEALTMADRIGVLNHGRLIQVGTPEDIYDRPATTFVAQLVGSPKINLLRAAIEDGTLVVADSDIRLPARELCAEPWRLPTQLILGVRPEDVRLDPAGLFTGEIVLTEPLGVETLIHIKIGEQMVVSTTPGIAAARIGERVRFQVARERLHFFQRVSGERVQV
jgi:multiple sugar transport system ATP-binding protein